MIYYPNEDTGVIKGSPVVHMSDDLKHDYYIAYKVIDLVVDHIKTKINSNIK